MSKDYNDGTKTPQNEHVNRPTPLEAFERIKNIPTQDIYSPTVKHFHPTCVEIVETALKRLEQLEEEKQSFDRATENKLKALKIIKEIAKSYDIEFCDNNQTMSFKIMLRDSFILETITIKNKEEYDLLKEVLL